MGNFSINHYARLEAQAKQITLRYVLDFAEIPTVTERDAMGVQGNAPVPEAARQAYLRAKALSLRDGLTMTIDGRPVPLDVKPVFLEFRPGAGGLDTMLLVLALTAPLPPANPGATFQVAYRDNNYAERTGWKEIVATGGDGAAIQNSLRGRQRYEQGTDCLPGQPDPRAAPGDRSDFHGRARRRFPRRARDRRPAAAAW